MHLRRSERALVFGTGAVTVLLAGLLLAGARSGRAQRPECFLPDGTILALQGATYGTRHAIDLTGSPWGPLGTFVRRKLGRPVRVLHADTREPGIVYWLTRSRPPSAAHLSLDDISAFCAVDEHGCVLMPEGGPDSLRPASGEAGYAPLQGVFPRRGGRVRLRFLDSVGKRLGELSVPEDAPQPPTAWPVEPLPITRRFGRHACTLSEAHTWLYKAGDWRGVPCAQVTMKWDPAERWEPDVLHMEIADETGNVRRNCFREEAGPGTWQIQALCPYEPAWRLRVPFCPTDDVPAAPADTWAIRGIPAQRPGSVLALGRAKRVSGVTVELFALAGRGWVEYRNYAAAPSSYQPPPREGTPMDSFMAHGEGYGMGPHLALSAHVSHDQRIAVRVVDDRGRVTTAHTTPGVHENVVALDVAPGAKRLDLYLFLQRSWTAEFTFKPPAPGKSHATWP